MNDDVREIDMIDPTDLCWGVLVWHSISQISCVTIGPSVEYEHDMMSKSGAGYAGVVFFGGVVKISRNAEFKR